MLDSKGYLYDNMNYLIIQNGIRIRKGSFFIPKFKGEKKWHYQ